MNKWLKELLSFAIIVFIVFSFRSSILNWYVIPSGSLLPTLKIGDRVVVNKLSYGFMFPFMETRVFSWSDPQRGDIVVFHGAKGDFEGNGDTSRFDETLIKRVVGLPGDHVTFVGGILSINGVLAKETLLSDRSPLKDSGSDSPLDNYDLYLESGFSHKPHYILRQNYGGFTESDARVFVVPENKLLLIGDNRDNSADGRVFGFIDVDRIYGRAFLIPFSTVSNDKSFLPRFRNDRWFKSIEN